MSTENNNEEIVDALIPQAENKVSKTQKMFSQLKENEQPVIPLPPDNMSDISYPQFLEPRCVICTSPFRDLAEHVYLDNGKKPQQVLKFFEKYYNAKMNWVQINTHMEQHCDFKKIATSGLKNYEQREEFIAPWIFREHQLALTALFWASNISIPSLRRLMLQCEPLFAKNQKKVLRRFELWRLLF